MLRNDIQMRQSFEDRFCDDICEEILQYLPLEDKLRLESVSKQFQRTIFQKQEKFNEYSLQSRLYSGQSFNFVGFESLLEKCQRLRIIKFHKIDNYLRESDGNHLIDLIVRYCHKITQLNSGLVVYDKNLNKLVQIIDRKKFTFVVDHNDGFTDENVIAIVDKLSSIRELNLTLDCSQPLTHMIGLKNLKAIRCLKDIRPVTDFMYLIENNPNLRSVEISYPTSDFVSWKHILENISKLRHLVELKTDCNLSPECFAESVQQMVRNCPQLKSITFRLSVLSEEELDAKISQFKELRQLKILRLYMYGNMVDSGTPLSGNFSLESFEGFEGLNHLTLHTNFPITEPMLTNIRLYLPNVRYLRISPQVMASPNTSQILSQFSHLEEIYIKLSNMAFDRSIGEEIERNLLTNCRRIRIMSIIDPYSWF